MNNYDLSTLDLFFVQPSGENWRGEIHKQGKIHGIDMSESTSDGYELALIAEVCNQNGIRSDYFIHRPDVVTAECMRELAEFVLTKNPKIVAIEAMSCYSNNVISLSKEIKKLNRDIVIISGGYHPSGYPEMLFDADGNIDYLVLGPGELVTMKLAKEILSGKNKDEIFSTRKRYDIPKGRFDGTYSEEVYLEFDKLVDEAAIAYLDNGVIKLLKRESEDMFKNIDEAPIPRRNPEIHKKVVCGRLALPLPHEQVTATLQITKGCPSACSYCQSANIYGRAGSKLVCDTSFSGRTKSVGNVVKELEYLTTLGVNCIFLTDLTTNLSGDYLKELSEAIVDYKNQGRINPKLTFYCMFRPHTEAQQKPLGLDYGIYDYMKRMGVIRIGFGIEFLIDKKLDDFNRSYKTTDVYKHLKAAGDAGIFTRGLSMYGTPDDKIELYSEYPDRMKTMPVDVWRMGAVTPYLGTKYGNCEFRKIYKDLELPRAFDNFNSSTLILFPEGQNITEQEMLKIKKDILKKVYSSEEWQIRMFEKGERYPELKIAINYFIDRLVEQNFLDKKPTMFCYSNIPQSYI